MKTIDQIKQDDNFLCALELPELQVYLTYLGGMHVEYHAFKDGALLFYGKDFKPSPMHNQDDIETIVDLLGFLTAQPGDTDADFFKGYSPAQMAWAESFECEQLRGQVSDFEQESAGYVEEEYSPYAVDLFNSKLVTPFTLLQDK